MFMPAFSGLTLVVPNPNMIASPGCRQHEATKRDSGSNNGAYGRRLSVYLTFLFPNGFPHIRLGLWSSGSVHVDVPVEVQIELLKNRDQSFHVIVGRFPGIH
jgi:hypothetical protein